MKNFLHHRQREQFRNQIFDHFGIIFGDAIEHFLGVLPREQLVRVTPDHFSQMRAQNADRIDHGISGVARFLHAVRRNPHGRNSEGRLARRNAFQLLGFVVGMDGQFAILQQLEARDLGAFERNHVFPRLERQIVGDADRRQDIAELGRQLPADAGDPLEQRRILSAFDQLHQSQSDFDRQRFHAKQRFEIFACGRCRRRLGAVLVRGRFLPHAPAHCPDRSRRATRNGIVGKPGNAAIAISTPAASSSGCGLLNTCF